MSEVRSGAIIDINLLPASRRPADVSPVAIVVAVVLSAAVLGIAPVSMRASDARDDASVMHDRAESVEQQVQSLQVDLNAVRAMRFEIDETKVKQQAIEAELTALRGGTRPLGQDLARLWDTAALYPQLRLKRVSEAPGRLSVTGAAPDPLAAIAYARALADVGFTSARMATFAPAGDGGEFTLEVTR
jgi:hypothetical protein